MSPNFSLKLFFFISTGIFLNVTWSEYLIFSLWWKTSCAGIIYKVSTGLKCYFNLLSGHLGWNPFGHAILLWSSRLVMLISTWFYYSCIIVYFNIWQDNSFFTILNQKLKVSAAPHPDFTFFSFSRGFMSHLIPSTKISFAWNPGVVYVFLAEPGGSNRSI